ncbi:F-box only protein 28 [Condylostylus longicornis]|uniref:F-box only protein 28 n=1 Tax=Condylostylus longicornis TaxID=2530218 RepID=UPI00244DCD56|nr:F-box only protein 28 [Condylostylus longicornis]
MNILDLPDGMLEQVIEFLSYDDIARNRLICKTFDRVGKIVLNRGFSKMVRRHSVSLKRIKSLLPRRESERRNHPMARHADILTCIETRISMLSMTYTKYMELNLCCFIPGKVIDEVNRILKLIETTNRPLRAHEVLQELRDISSMAIEHFDEKIAHLLKKGFVELTFQKYSSGSNPPTPKTNSQTNRNSPQFIFGVSCIEDHFKPRDHVIVTPPTNVMQRTCGTTFRCVENSNKLQKLAQKYKIAIKKFNRMIHIQNKQARQLRENAVTMSEMNTQIIELKRRFELIKSSRTVDSSDMTSDTNITEPCANNLNIISIGNADNMKAQKGRTATIILKRRIDEDLNKAEVDLVEPPAKATKLD